MMYNYCMFLRLTINKTIKYIFENIILYGSYEILEN